MTSRPPLRSGLSNLTIAPLVFATSAAWGASPTEDVLADGTVLERVEQKDGGWQDEWADVADPPTEEDSEGLTWIYDGRQTRHGTDENTSLSYPMSAVGNKPAVLIGIETGSTAGGGGDWNDHSCSGVLVANRWVLTAAHCASAGTYLYSGYQPAGAFRVCSYGNDFSNADCTHADDMVTNGSWLLWHGAADDYVLLHLADTLNSGSLGYHPISSASAATIEGFDSVITGYPGNIGSGGSHCIGNTSTSSFHVEVEDDGIELSVGPTWDSSSLVDVTATLHKSANDLGPGWSGGGLRYEPASSTWFITGLQSSEEYVGIPPAVEGAHIGPNHDVFRAWVAANI